MNLIETRCPNCDASDYRAFRTVRDRFRVVPDAEYRIVRCLNCRLLYLNPRPGADDLEQFYAASGYDPFVSNRAGFSLGKSIYTSVRFFTVRNKARRILRGLGSSLRILDVGCATGELLAIFQKLGHQTFGVEPDPGAAEFARKQGLQVVTGSIEDVQSSNGPFDIIVFWHVFEHVYALRQTLERTHGLLKDGGRLAIAVPNPSSLDASWYGDNWVAWDTPRHLYHFEPDVMLSVLNSGGFRGEHVGAVPFDAMYHCLLSDKKSPSGFLRAGSRGALSFLSGAIGGKGSSELYFGYKI